MPDGSSIQIENLPATDAAGHAGLEDEVDYHTRTLLKGMACSVSAARSPSASTTATSSRRSASDSPKSYLRVKLDDPSLTEPISGRGLPIGGWQQGGARVEPAAAG
jgi:type IV secretory pathway VirB10-like protein